MRAPSLEKCRHYCWASGAFLAFRWDFSQWRRRSHDDDDDDAAVYAGNGGERHLCIFTWSFCVACGGVCVDRRFGVRLAGVEIFGCVCMGENKWLLVVHIFDFRYALLFHTPTTSTPHCCFGAYVVVIVAHVVVYGVVFQGVCLRRGWALLLLLLVLACSLVDAFVVACLVNVISCCDYCCCCGYHQSKVWFWLRLTRCRRCSGAFYCCVCYYCYYCCCWLVGKFIFFSDSCHFVHIISGIALGEVAAWRWRLCKWGASREKNEKVVSVSAGERR